MKARYSNIELVLIFTLGVSGYLGIMAGIWWLWGSVLGSLWPDGPENLIDPPYLVFVGATILVSWAVSLLRGRK